MIKTVVFACVHNAGRSQMAAAWFNAMADNTVVQARSAGTQPGTHIHPEVLTAMREVGVEISTTPQLLTDNLLADTSMLITMGCGEECPVTSAVDRADWPFEDPKGKSLERVREIRDQICVRVFQLLRTQGWLHSLLLENPHCIEPISSHNVSKSPDK